MLLWFFFFFFFVRQEEEFNWLLKEEVHAVLKQLQDVLKVKPPRSGRGSWNTTSFDVLPCATGPDEPVGLARFGSSHPVKSVWSGHTSTLRIWPCATQQQMTSPVWHQPCQNKCCCAISCVWCLRISNNKQASKHGLSVSAKNVNIASVPMQNYYIFFI